MKLILPAGLDPSALQKDIDALRAKEESREISIEVKAETTKARRALESLAASATDLRKELEGASATDRIEGFVGALESLGEVGPKIFGETGEAAASLAADMAETAAAGWALGAAFGPLGAVMGAALAVAKPLGDALDAQSESLAKLDAETRAYVDGLAQYLEVVGYLGVGGGVLSTVAVKTQAEVLEANTKTQETYRAALGQTGEALFGVGERALSLVDGFLEIGEGAEKGAEMAEKAASRMRSALATPAKSGGDLDPLGLAGLFDSARAARSLAFSEASAGIDDASAALARIIAGEESQGPRDLGLSPVVIPVQLETSALDAGIVSLEQALENLKVTTQETLGLAFGAGAQGLVSEFFDSIAEGERLSAAALVEAAGERASAALREQGTRLVGQGAAHAGEGAAASLFGLPQGPGLVGLGLAEIGQGLAWGGIGAGLGALLGRLGGRGESEERFSGGGLGAATRSPARDNLRDPGPQDLGGVTIYAGGGPGSTTIYAGDGGRSQVQAARELARIEDKGRRASSPGIRGLGGGR